MRPDIPPAAELFPPFIKAKPKKIRTALLDALSKIGVQIHLIEYMERNLLLRFFS